MCVSTFQKKCYNISYQKVRFFKYSKLWMYLVDGSSFQGSLHVALPTSVGEIIILELIIGSNVIDNSMALKEEIAIPYLLDFFSQRYYWSMLMFSRSEFQEGMSLWGYYYSFLLLWKNYFSYHVHDALELSSYSLISILYIDLDD